MRVSKDSRLYSIVLCPLKVYDGDLLEILRTEVEARQPCWKLSLFPTGFSVERKESRVEFKFRLAMRARALLSNLKDDGNGVLNSHLTLLRNFKCL